MTVKIIIKRMVPENNIKYLTALLKQLRALANNQPGYISGETLRNFENPQENLVISSWQSIDDWKNWLNSKERAEIQEKIDLLLGEKTEYQIYHYG
ncbi:MAG: antibiotic biosynthesis monooxygenase family protein [Thermodesulfobacteriota bacterium]|nr:antibiotic biosynthesis monooxygenase family protein [Thermodesulfobacteriota bacterium]